MRQITAVGIASCLGGNHVDCQLGATVLCNSMPLKEILATNGIQLSWTEPIRPGIHGVEPTVAGVCRRADELAFRLSNGKRPFIFFSGDHSGAMGIWKGAMTALLPERRMGLIWIDAHMDAHTFITSPSGNLHGMPVAALLGAGDNKLQCIYGESPILQPTNIVLLGLRSFEVAEQKLLQRLGVRYFIMKQELDARAIKHHLLQAVAMICDSADSYGISIDLDAIDPRDAPAVGTPEPNGISGKLLCECLAELNGDPRLLGLEIAEFSPLYDLNHRTEQLIAKLVCALYGKSSKLNRFFGSDTEGINANSSPMPSSLANW
ncbi:MAG: arginase [Candidatus Thiodiazotropha sp. L084R]